MLHHLLTEGEFWVLLSVVIFAVAVARPLTRMIVGGLDARSERIRADLDEARRLRQEAEQLLADYQRQQREAAAQATEMVAHARQEAERIASQAARDLDQALTRRQQLAAERITQAEAKAVEEIRAIAVDVAINAARQVIVAELDASRGAALLDGAIAALPQQLR